MDFFGIGLAEIFFIVLIALIIFGPRDMVKAGRTIGRFLRKTIFSPTMIAVQHKIRHLPYELMREAGIEEDELNLGIDQIQKDLSKASLLNEETAKEYVREVEEAAKVPAEWVSLPSGNSPAEDQQDNTGNSILPPSDKPGDEETGQAGLQTNEG
jgi:hypothetical protein